MKSIIFGTKGEVMNETVVQINKKEMLLTVMVPCDSLQHDNWEEIIGDKER